MVYHETKGNMEWNNQTAPINEKNIQTLEDTLTVQQQQHQTNERIKNARKNNDAAQTKSGSGQQQHIHIHTLPYVTNLLWQLNSVFFLLWHRSELVVLGTPLLSLSGCAFLFTSLFLRCVLWLSSLWPLSYVYFLFAHYSWCSSTMAKKERLS